MLDAGGEGDGEGDQVVFRVTTDVSSLWRTMTFDRYDGRTWRRSPELEPGPGRPDEGTIFVPPGIGDEERGELTLDHTVRIEASSVGVLPAAPVPFAVQLAQGRAYVAEDATVYPEPLLGRGATYRVTSILPYGADMAAADADERVPAEVRRFYLEHPAIPERVAALAAELTVGATTRHARVVAVQEWLAANTEFRSGTPPLPAGADPVDRFLFEDGGGSSQQAASAMALLLRSAGVPARIGAGYLPGNRSPFGGEFVVRARHATTWVEVWFPSAGWVAFDPTLRYRGPEPVDDSLLSRFGRILRALWWAGALALAGLGAWLAARLLRRRRERLARPWATRCYERLRRAGARHGRPRRPEETPAEYCSALAAALPDERLDRVGELVTVGAYAGREPTPEETAWADEVVADVERRAPRRPPGGRRGAGPGGGGDGGPARGLAPPAPPVRAGRPGGGPG
ncbi:MAG TPA: transglutaminaseTgpA domain-containing protein [Acidimicrobiales bacterium]|nr:transglutaminaseTgpA domain-containing protein [Acidimicrobiales bacterium]HVM02105.1 transglutaminaseTgpA domain-containing protein [Acidimicrobiales bacterium]